MKTVHRIVAFVFAVIAAATVLTSCGREEGDYTEYRLKRLQWEAGNPYNHK